MRKAAFDVSRLTFIVLIGARCHRRLAVTRSYWSRSYSMDRERLFGGNPLGVIIRLAVLSIVVGIVLSALDIHPANIVERLGLLIRRIYDMGFGLFQNAFGYLILGAVVVVPIWLLTRVFSAARNRDPR